MKLFAATMLALSASSAFASGSDQLLITGASAKGGAAYSIDLSTDGRAVVFQAFLTVEGAAAENFDLNKCLSGLPKGWTGKCAFVENKVVVVGYSPTQSPLPAGTQNVGSIKVSGIKAVPLAVSDVEIGARDGSLISSAAKVVE